MNFTIDCYLTLHKHVNNVCTSAHVELHRIASIGQYLSCDATKMLISVFVFSKLDNCSSLLTGAFKNLIDKLQWVQNAAARLVVRCRLQHNITPVLCSLHWLPISCRIQYKVSSLCHGSLSEGSPRYLSEVLHKYTPSSQFRSSSDSFTLRVPATNRKTREKVLLLHWPHSLEQSLL